MGATALANSIATGESTALEVVEAALAAIDPALNAFTVVTADAALERAAAVDRGEVTGRLAGVPITVKDHVWLAGLPATNGSRALADFVAPTTCVGVQRLLDAGAIVIGKTTNPEFCYRGITESELWGVTRNPRDPSRTTGGSSGGAAASVASGVVPIAVGTDGGGSIRIPSAFCGVAGLKPTFGRVPKLPGFRGWPTLSVTGPIAASVRDLELAISIMAGPDAADPLSYPTPTDPERPWRDLRIAVSDDLGFAEIDDDVRTSFRAALDALADDGARLVEAHPDPVDPPALWDAVALPEGYASEGPLVEAHPDLVGTDAAALTLAGRDLTAQAYLDAQEARGAFTTGWLRFFDSYDVLLTPTMPVTAFATGLLAPPTIAGHPVPESFDAWCALALPANLAGLPAVTVPIAPGAGGLPVGLQVMAGRFRDTRALNVAAAVERLMLP